MQPLAAWKAPQAATVCLDGVSCVPATEASSGRGCVNGEATLDLVRLRCHSDVLLPGEMIWCIKTGGC